MTKESITTRFIKELKSFFVAQVSEGELGVLYEIEGYPIANKYVNCLLGYMYYKGLRDIELCKDTPLPPTLDEFKEGVPEEVTYADVEARFREMIALTNPDAGQQIKTSIQGEKCVISVDFEPDKCRLRLKEEEWGALS